MSKEQFSNQAQTTLSGAISPGATSLAVSSAANFPTSGQFRIVIDSEIFLVTAVSGTTFTVLPGYEGSTPSNHSNGAIVAHVLTAGVISSIYNGALANRVQLVGQRCGGNGSGSIGAGNYFKTYQRICCPNGASAIQFVYANSYINSAQGEVQLPPSMYQAKDVTLSGSPSGYVAGEVLTFNVTGIAPVKVLIGAVSAGVPTAYEVCDGGLLSAPLANGVSQSSTSGSGSGATATFTWKTGVMGLHIGVDPVWGTQAGQNNGTNSVQNAVQGNLVPLVRPTGNWNLLVPMGNLLVTDLIPIAIPIGGYFGLRTCGGYGTPWAGRAAIQSGWAPTAPSANYEQASSGSTFTEQSNTGTISASAGNMVQPLAILGIPLRYSPTSLCIGDSRMAGTASGINAYGGSYDLMDNDGNLGPYEKALANINGGLAWPWVNYSVSGAELSAYDQGILVGRSTLYQLIKIARPTHVHIELNVNDIVAGENFTAIKAVEALFIAELKGLGVKYVSAETTDPWTTSTDGYATVANQTHSSASSNIISRNDNLAAGTWAPYDFFVDNRSIVESAVDSGYWICNGTAGYGTGIGSPNHASPLLVTQKAANTAAVFAANVKF